MRFRRHQEAAQAATTRLLLAFAAAVLLLLVAVNGLLALAWYASMPLASRLPALFFETNTALVLLFVLGGSWVETLRLREGGAHVAKLAGARPADPAGGHTVAQRLEKRFVNVVQEMALAAGTRPPAAWIVANDYRINAFAAGWAADDAVVAVTRGALERLNRAELQGVVAHEISHLVHEDTRLNMRLIGLVWGLQMIHGFGRTLVAPGERDRWRLGVLIGLALMAIGWLGWLAGRVLQASVSRQREFLADASAVKYTRQVEGIGGALRKIAGAAAPPRAVVHPASLSHLWLAAAAAAPARRLAWGRWLATHPPLAERLQRLYGRRVDALRPELLPVASDEGAVQRPDHSDHPAHADAALGFAATDPLPAQTGPGANSAAGGPAGAAAATVSRGAGSASATAVSPGVGPAAARDDATQNPAFRGTAEREREALQRIEFWHSPNERHAALSALLIVEDDDAAPWPAWQAATASFRSAADLLADVQALGPGARRQVFETIARRTAEAGDGRALLLRASRLVATDDARLRLWVLRRNVLPATRRAPKATRAVEELAASVAAAHALLAGMTGWPVPAAADRAPVSLLRTALRLRRLHPMQRPRVVRGWMQAAAAAQRLDDPRAVSALILACSLLDSPVPPALEARLAAFR